MITVIVTLVLVGVFSFLLSLVVHPPFGLDNWIWLIVMGSLLIILVRFACMQPVLLELTEGLHRDYVKNLSKAVVIRTNHGYYIVSCEHPGDLIHELKKSMHVL